MSTMTKRVPKSKLGVISLDLGTMTGFEVLSRGVFSRDVINLSRHGKFREDGFLAFYLTVEGLIRILQKHNEVWEIVVEKPHAGRFFHSSRILFGLMAVLELLCQKKGIELKVFSPKAIKKFWTGSGNAKKEEMLAKAQKEVSERIQDHNVADAVALMRMYLAQRKVIDE